MEVNVHEAKTHLPKLVQRAALREEVIIAKAGTPVAKHVPINRKPKTRILGRADFIDRLSKEIEDLFYP